MKKRALSFILALVLVISTFPLSIFANVNTEEIIEETLDEIIEEVSDEITDRVIDDSAHIEQGFSLADDSLEGEHEPIELDLPKNAPQVHMTDNQQFSSDLILNEIVRTTQTNNIDRESYTVLVLDTSSATNFSSDGKVFYRADTAVKHVKESAKKFIEQVQAASGTNNVAIVTYRGKGASVVSTFTTDVNQLTRSINNINASGGTRNVAAGIEAADNLISKITDPDVVKNVILFSTGMTNDGSHNYDGHYDENTIASKWQRADTKVRLYGYANVAYEAAQSLKKKATLYTIGLFNTMEDMPEAGREVVQFFKLSTLDWATSSDHFYDVKDPNDLEFIFGDVADEIIKKKGKFKYAGVIVPSHDSESTYYYEDSYFLDSGKKYNPQLGTMSLAFQLSTWPSHETKVWENKTKNVRELLTGDNGIGFKEFEQSDSWEDVPTRDSIGVVAANKKIVDIIDDNKEYTLIALAIRGGGYGSEWSSNFAIGERGSHTGFTNARDDVLDFLKEYIEKHSIDGDVKLWLTGYSRAGATSNMVGGALIDGYNLPNVSLNQKDLFVYTFATPQGALRDDLISSGKDYSSIHNTMNFNDIVPLVAPASWGFARYGMDQYLPSYINDNFESSLANMLTEFYKLEGARDEGYKIRESTDTKNIRIDRSRWLPGGDPLFWMEDSEVPQNDVLKGSMDFITTELLISRSNYYNNLEVGIKEIFGIINEDDEKMQAFFEEFIDRVDEDVVKGFLSPMWSLNPLKKFPQRIAEVRENVEEFVRVNTRAISRDLNINITDLFIDSLASVVGGLIENIAIDIWENDTDSLNLILKFIDLYKAGSIAQPHFPEINLAWMMSRDTNYNALANAADVASSYRIIRINCPVDVNVYDSKNTKVASIINDVSQDVGSSIVSFTNAKGEKLIYLPAEEDYNIQIKGTDDGELTYSITEHDLTEGGISQLINYYSLPFTKGESFTGIVPAFNKSEIKNGIPNGSEAQYKLLDDSNKEILDKEELVGSDIENNYYRVTAIAENDSGFVDGTGTFLKGNFAKVTAMPLSGSSFLGWYIGNELVSTELVYRFGVIEDIEISAKFEPVEIHELNFSSGKGGKIINDEGYYTVGTEIGVSAKADPGYRFTEWTTTEGVLDSSTNSTAWFTMPDSYATITAKFEPIEYEEWIADLVTDKQNKEWTIKLSMPVDENSIEESIFVVDKNYNKVEFIKIEVENENKSGYIKLKNNGNFDINEEYWILINDSLKSTNGKSLGKFLRAKFTVE